jgi:hypothetical protein
MAQLGSTRIVGPIVEVAADHLVILNPDDKSKVTVKPDADARIVKDRVFGAKLSELKAGDYAMVGGEMKDGALQAKFIASSTEQSQTLRQNLGKTMVAGKVVAVDPDSASMKVRRVDGEDQTLQFDENSSFKRMVRGGGESITMADIKPGDGFSAKGAAKNGSFAVTEFTLMPRGGMMFGGAGRGSRPQQEQQ